VGPEHAYLRETGRAEYTAVGDREALQAFEFLCRAEGILPALESAHAVAWLLGQRENLPAETLTIVNLSGRGDKDVRHAMRAREELDRGADSEAPGG
jgi:tryptophan synthase beta chain